MTGPVGEALALRVDGSYRKRDGYIQDANTPDRQINNIDRWSVRGQALLDTGDITLRLIADYYETDEQCCGAVSVVRGSLAPVIQGIAAAQGRVGLYTGPASDRIQAMSPNRDYGEAIRDWGVSGELNWDLGGATLTSITAYRGLAGAAQPGHRLLRIDAPIATATAARSPTSPRSCGSRARHSAACSTGSSAASTSTRPTT
ncbi:MAG: hypothetical protein WDN24_13030 [Sphingomonas sp.]